MKYTPWKVRGNEIICSGSGSRIAQVNVGWPDDEIIAHANLIAASPRMAKLLERLVENGWDVSISKEAEEILQTLA